METFNYSTRASVSTRFASSTIDPSYKELPDNLRSQYFRQQTCRPASSVLGAWGEADPDILWRRGFGVGIRRLTTYKQGEDG